MNTQFVMGLEFGTDSARAILVNAINGEMLDEEVAYYPQWMQGLYCDFSLAQFRHHPQDYLDTLQQTVSAITQRHPDLVNDIVGLSLDTTASTLCMVDREGTPLALKPEFADNPNAMFVIWKDHTGQPESEEINAMLPKFPVNYAKYSGNAYSAECFWCKVWHLIRTDEAVRQAAWTAEELCDFIPATLTGVKDASAVKMGHCCAGAKLMWAEEWGGYPPEEFFQALDSRLLPIRNHLPQQNFGCDHAVGRLTPEWAERLGLKAGITVGAGNVDSHSGAVGGGIQLGTMVMNMGTSACYMSVTTPEQIGDTVVEGIFGQVDAAILPKMIGFEAGLSSFGDVFAWYKRLLAWPLQKIVGKMENLDEAVRKQIIENAEDSILKQLAEEAEKLEITPDLPLATDWFNGRRTPYTNNSLTATISGLSLASDAPKIYYALVEATAFATLRVISHLEQYGVPIERMIAVGGIAKKSPFVMQMMADVLGKQLDISACGQAGAMGSAIHAATSAGLYPSVTAAQEAMCSGAARSYYPRMDKRKVLLKRYEKYITLGMFTEDKGSRYAR